MRTVLAIALAAALTLVTAGCAGESAPADTQAEAASDPTGTTGSPADDPAVGDALGAFVDAAGNGDVEGMWALLSERSREQLGPTEEDFEERYAREFQAGVGSFAGTPYETVLSVRTESGWGVAAIAGERTRAGMPEYAAYGAALTEEDGAWRLELGDPVRLETTAPGRTTSDPLPPVRFEIHAEEPVEEAGLWLDGAALPGTVEGSGGSVTVSATPGAALSSGWHVVVVFGRAGAAAAAGATPFQVEGDGEQTAAA